MSFAKPVFLQILSFPLLLFGFAGILVGIAEGNGGHVVGGVVSGILGTLCLYY